MPNAISAYQANLFNESVSAVTATPSVTIGQDRYEGGREYRYFYNATSNEDIRPGRCFKIASGSSGYSIDAALAASAANTFSVATGFVVHATVGTGNYFWGCVRGFCQVEIKTPSSQVSKGNLLIPAVSGTVAYCNTAVTGRCYGLLACGRATADSDATTTTSSFTAYINCTGAV
jgi:hypothetical protein